MTYVHEDAELGQLVQIVARETGIAAALIEKDYWVTHTLWALHQTGLDIWFKGGTSLSKGFEIIQRFSMNSEPSRTPIPSRADHPYRCRIKQSAR